MKHKLVNLSLSTAIVSALLICKTSFPMDKRLNGSLETEYLYWALWILSDSNISHGGMVNQGIEHWEDQSSTTLFRELYQYY